MRSAAIGIQARSGRAVEIGWVAEVMAANDREIKDRTYVLEIDSENSIEVDCRKISSPIELEIPIFPLHSEEKTGGYVKIQRKRSNVSSNKPKVIAAGFAQRSEITIDPDVFFFEYDHLLITDTNTRSDAASGDVISVTAVVHAFVDRSFEGSEDKHRVLCGILDAMEIRNARVDPERLGWALVLEAIQRSELGDPRKRIAIVGDAHLSAHKKIIARDEPVIDGVFLPSHVSLVYASADTGKESRLNELMDWCDKGAKYVLSHIMENRPSDQFRRAPAGRPYEWFRTWTIHT